SDRQARSTAPSCRDRGRRRDALSSWPASQPKPVARVERSLARDRTEILVQCLGSDRIIVGLIFEQREFRAGPWLLAHDGFVLAPPPAVARIAVGQRTGDRLPCSRRTWVWEGQICPVVGAWGRSVVGGARAGGGQCGWLQDSALEPDVLVVTGLVRADRWNTGDED